MAKEQANFQPHSWRLFMADLNSGLHLFISFTRTCNRWLLSFAGET